MCTLTASSDVDETLADMQREQVRARQANSKTLDAFLNWMQVWSASFEKRSDVEMCFQTDGGVKACFECTVPPAMLTDAKAIPADTLELFRAYIQRDAILPGDALANWQQS